MSFAHPCFHAFAHAVLPRCPPHLPCSLNAIHSSIPSSDILPWTLACMDFMSFRMHSLDVLWGLLFVTQFGVTKGNCLMYTQILTNSLITWIEREGQRGRERLYFQWFFSSDHIWEGEWDGAPNLLLFQLSSLSVPSLRLSGICF